MDCWDLVDLHGGVPAFLALQSLGGLQHQWKNRRHPFRFYRFEDNEIPLMALFSMGEW
jgi:hypothetical protein